MISLGEPRTHTQGDEPTVVEPAQMLFLGQPFTNAEAQQAGLSIKVLRRLIGEGLVRRVLKGVFVDSAAADTLELRACALFKVINRNVVICDRTAAWLHGVDIVGQEGYLKVPPVEVYRTQGDNRLRRQHCKAGTRTLDDLEIQLVNGLRVTTPLRTALDLGRLLPRGDAIGAIDAMLRVAGLAVEDLLAELPRFRGARGVVQLRQLARLADPRSESPAESRLRLQIIDAGLPLPEVQWKILNSVGLVRFRLDLAYPELKLAIEYDGAEFHSSTADKARDEQRRSWLRRMGWTVVILKAGEVYGRDPSAARRVAAKRRELLARV